MTPCSCVITRSALRPVFSSVQPVTVCIAFDLRSRVDIRAAAVGDVADPHLAELPVGSAIE